MYKVTLAKYTGSLRRLGPRCLIGEQIRLNRLKSLQKYASSSAVSKAGVVVNSIPIPGPRQLPYIGTFFTIVFGKGLNKFHEQTHEWYQKYGDVFQYKILGKTFIGVSDVAMAEKLHRTEAGGKWPYRDFQVSFGELLDIQNELKFPSSLIDLNGEEWAKLRAVLGKRLLRPLEVKNYYDGFNGTALDAIKLIRSTKDESDIIQDMKDILVKWSMESIGTFAFGERTGLLNNPPDPVANTVYRASIGLIYEAQRLSMHKWAKYIFRSRHKKLKQSMQTVAENGALLVNKTFLELENSAKEGRPVEEGVGKSFVAYLAGKDGMSVQECTSHALDVYRAALDTTPTVISWLLYVLACNPDAQEALFEEIREQLPEDGMLTYEAAQDMPYLRACMKESTRLNNPIPFLPRFPAEDIEANGYIIPAKTIVLIQQRSMSLSERYFTEPLKFQPERWIRGKNETSLPNPFLSLPFGYGPRSCVGRRVAEAEIQVFITQLVKRFRIKYKGKPQNGVLELLFIPEHPLTFEFSER